MRSSRSDDDSSDNDNDNDNEVPQEYLDLHSVSLPRPIPARLSSSRPVTMIRISEDDGDDVPATASSSQHPRDVPGAQDPLQTTVLSGRPLLTTSRLPRSDNILSHTSPSPGDPLATPLKSETSSPDTGVAQNAATPRDLLTGMSPAYPECDKTSTLGASHLLAMPIDHSSGHHGPKPSIPTIASIRLPVSSARGAVDINDLAHNPDPNAATVRVSPKQAFLFPPEHDMIFPPTSMPDTIPTPEDPTWGVLFVSSTVTTSTSFLPTDSSSPIGGPSRTWRPITDQFLSTIVTFRSTGHVVMHQQLVLPGGQSPFQHPLYPQRGPPVGRRQVRRSQPRGLLDILRHDLTPSMTFSSGALGVKMSIPKHLWRLDTIEVIGGWVAVIVEINNDDLDAGTSPTKKDRRSKAKSKAQQQRRGSEKTDGFSAVRPERIRLRESIEGHIIGRGARELPLWHWACEARNAAGNHGGGDGAQTQTLVGTTGDEDDDAAAAIGRSKPRHLLSIRVRKDAVEEYGGYEILLQGKASPLDRKYEDARRDVDGLERSIKQSRTALGDHTGLGPDVTLQQLDGVITSLQTKFMAMDNSDTGGSSSPIAQKVENEAQKTLEEMEDVIQKVTKMRNLETVKKEKVKMLSQVEKQRRERGAWLGVEPKEWVE